MGLSEPRTERGSRGRHWKRERDTPPSTDQLVTSAPRQRERPRPTQESVDVDTAHADGSGGSGPCPGGAGDPGAPNGQLHSLVQAVPGRLYLHVLCRPQQEQPANPRARNHPEQRGPEQSTARGRAPPRPPRRRGEVWGPSRTDGRAVPRPGPHPQGVGLTDSCVAPDEGTAAPRVPPPTSLIALNHSQ